MKNPFKRKIRRAKVTLPYIKIEAKLGDSIITSYSYNIVIEDGQSLTVSYPILIENKPGHNTVDIVN